MSKRKKNKPAPEVTSAEDSPRLPVVVQKRALPAKRKPAPPLPRTPFDQYIAEILKVPLLSREEELDLANQLKDSGDKEAAKRLVEANLRFVVKMAYSYRHYNVKLIDLIQEGNIGLMRAVEKFNPDRGYRLISYAVWWIKAYMQNYIIRSWSMVRLGTTRMQRQLFFKSQTDKESLEHSSVEETLSEEAPSEGAVLVPAEVRRKKADKELTLAQRDFSLDTVVDKDSKMTYVDVLPSPEPQQEEELARQEIMAMVADKLKELVTTLPDKELFILQNRLLTDEPMTLQEIGEEFGVSRERIRQIEVSLKKRLGKELDSIDGIADLVQ